MLRTITEQQGRLTAADRAECRLLEQTLRDEIRGRQLLTRTVREQVMLHRRRGAIVQVNDDGGLADFDPFHRELLLAQVAEAITGLTSDRIIIRTASTDSPTAVIVVATSVDPVAAALGLDDEDGGVDLWLEVPRTTPTETGPMPARIDGGVPPLWIWDPLRPVLELRLWYFRRLVKRNLYLPPVVSASADREADQIAHIGSIDAVRVGVTDDDLTTLSRVASNVSAQRQRTLQWQHAGTRLLTAKQAARHSMAAFSDVDAAVIVLGFSDVLLMTHPVKFEHDLSQLIAALRQTAGETCGVVLTGLAPMDEFRYTARLGRRRIRQQVARLNTSMSVVAADTRACLYVPPPTSSRPQGRPGDEQYSWATIHHLWSLAISPALISLLDSLPSHAID